MNWSAKRVLVTGGASFIGSHLTTALVERSARVRVVDDLSSGRLENIEHHVAAGEIEFLHRDLRDAFVADRATTDIDVVFHLAADHGGRGYVELHQAACATNLAMDGALFLACRNNDVEQLVYASSGCVYPNHVQADPDETLYLTEEMVGPPYDADNMYGWAKLMGEMTLQAFCRDWGMRGVSCRYFTVYGERGKEDHAVIAMIARAFIGQDPFEVWGDGRQVRNWTHIDDIVAGTLLAAETVTDGQAINLGTMERIRVIDAAREVLSYTGHNAEFRFRPQMPTGPVNRVADNSLARQLLDWEPRVPFVEGLHRTIDWYYSTQDRERVRQDFDEKLVSRHVEEPVAATGLATGTGGGA